MWAVSAAEELMKLIERARGRKQSFALFPSDKAFLYLIKEKSKYKFDQYINGKCSLSSRMSLMSEFCGGVCT